MRRITVADLLREARAGLVRVAPREAHEALEAGDVLVDVRLAAHRDEHGHITGALEIALNVLEWRLDPDSPSRHPAAPALEERVIVLCEQGYSSSLAAHRLQTIGFEHATDVIGGFESWVAEGLPVSFPRPEHTTGGARGEHR
ncbi:MAG: rhodanese-like domain-containing protein [Nitriliruptorales bacterium]|nr:rhodanese-like domain-containing protein [Nitriliruptorales bacterium]